MVIYRSSDSLSRYDPNSYSNIYDVRKRPDIKQESTIAATKPIHEDTIEILQDKYKKEALSRLRHTSKYVIAQNSFIRIGKYLFLAIAFPPYFALYGLPKWIIVEGIPPLFSMWMGIWNKIQQQSQKQLESGTDKIIRLSQFVQKISQVLIQPLVHLAVEIRRSMRRLREQTLGVFQRAIRKFKNPFKLHLNLTKQFGPLQSRLRQVREKWSQQVQKIGEHIQGGIQWVKESPQILLGWIQLQSQTISQHVLLLGPHWKKRLQTSQQTAQRTVASIFRSLKNGMQSIKEGFAPLSHFYQHQWRPRWQKFAKICQGKWQHARDFFQQKHQRALHFLQARQDKLKSLSSHRFLSYLMIHPWLKSLPLYLQQMIKKWLSSPLIHRLCERGVKAYSWVARAFLQVIIYGLQIQAQGVSYFIKSCNLFYFAVKMIGQKSLTLLKMGQSFLLKGSLYVLYHFLISVTMIFILFIWGMHALGECMSVLASRFPFRNNMKAQF